MRWHALNKARQPMKTKLSGNNPFLDRLTWAYAYESIPDGAAVLDYGCFNGEFINRLAEARKVAVYGVDKNRDALKSYQGPHEVKLVEKSIPFRTPPSISSLCSTFSNIYSISFLYSGKFIG
jgi:SAM-dependent methyltransferase